MNLEYCFKVLASLILSRISSWIRVWRIFWRRFSFIMVSAKPDFLLISWPVCALIRFYTDVCDSITPCILLPFLMPRWKSAPSAVWGVGEVFLRDPANSSSYFLPCAGIKMISPTIQSSRSVSSYRHYSDWCFFGCVCVGSGVDCEANVSARLQEHGSVEASSGEHVSGLLIPSSNHTDAADPAG